MNHHTLIKEDSGFYSVVNNTEHPLHGQRHCIEFDLTDLNIPSDVRVVQWYGNVGDVEKDGGNESITDLPDWMNQLVSKFNQAIVDEIDHAYAGEVGTARTIPTEATEE